MGTSNKMLVTPRDGLASHPGGSSNIRSCFMLHSISLFPSYPHSCHTPIPIISTFLSYLNSCHNPIPIMPHSFHIPFSSHPHSYCTLIPFIPPFQLYPYSFHTPIPIILPFPFIPPLLLYPIRFIHIIFIVTS